MTAPVPKVEAGFGSTWKTADVDIDWTDITSYVRVDEGVSATRGRGSVRDRFNATDIRLKLNNEARLFDASYALFPADDLYPEDTLYPAGTLYGLLKPGVPIRVTTTPSGESSRAVARGHVTGWPQRYDIGNTYGYVPVQGYGIFDKVARAKLPQSAVDVEVLADSPAAYWKLDDNTEAEMLDSSGNDNHGLYDNPDLGQDPLVSDGGKAVFFDQVGDHRGKINEALITAYPFTLEAWVKFPRYLPQAHCFITTLNNEAGTIHAYLVCYHSALNPDGCASLAVGVSSAVQYHVRGGTTIDDDEIHHIVGVAESASSFLLYVDGAAESLTTVTAGPATITLADLRLYSVGNLWNTKFGDFGIGGNIDNAAIYLSALDAARVLAHYDAGMDPYDGDTTDERLDRILDVVGLPADRRDFEACTTLLGPTVLNQQRALDYMRLVEASEDGRLFETADGKIRFLDRYWGLIDTHATVSQLTFSDESGVRYSDIAIEPTDELLVNVATVSREGASALTIRNEASAAEFGEADTSVSVLLQTDAEARSLGEHIVLVRGSVTDRVPVLRVPVHKYSAAQQAAILDLEIGYRVSVERTPQGAGDPIELELIIEGVEHEINTFEHWMNFNVSVAPGAADYFLWGTSTWSETTTWGW